LTRAPRPSSLHSVRRRRLAFAVSLALWLAPGLAGAVEPWSDPDPPAPPERYALGRFGFRGGAEYRAQVVYVNPIALNSETGRRASWIDQRLRLDAGVDYEDAVRLVTSVDVLDGVLWGDNGTFGQAPAPNAGTNVGAKNPNFAKACMGYRGGDALQPESYGYTLCDAAPVMIRKLYGDVALPFGLLRVGRQSVNSGTGVQAADGDGRPNRFGVSNTGTVVDRVLFATKPLEAFKPAAERNRSETEGMFVGVTYDRLVTDDPQLFSDDVHQVAAGFRYLAPRWAGGRDLWLSGYYVHRWDGQFATHVNSVGARAYSQFGHFSAGFDAAANLGSTREISEAYKVISNDPAVDQSIRQFGARAVARYDRRLWTAYLEMDYASGSSDPQARAPLTQFVFPEDTNVGLLLFKRVLAFQTARSSLAALETLRRLGSPSYPAEAVATRGAFTNALAIFPQVDLRPHKSVLVRGGVLFAWAAAPVADPVASLPRRDGPNIQDDLVNFVGGKPGTYYGTELDGRIQYRFLEHFELDLEGAVLFPGDALRDADGNAARSVLLQGRSTFFF
jgi:hypothetical protein